MPEPATKLDTRFSEPGSAATPWVDTTRVLEAAQLFWITTVRAEGRPQVSPLVAVLLDDTLYFSTGAAEQKALNLRTNPNVALTTGCNGWDQGLNVVVEGPAVQVTDDSLLTRLTAPWSASGMDGGAMRRTTACSIMTAAARRWSTRFTRTMSWPPGKGPSRTLPTASRGADPAALAVVNSPASEPVA